MSSSSTSFTTPKRPPTADSLEHLRPKVLLGLTATPERADGQDIVHWFDDRIACDMRLWQALDGAAFAVPLLRVADGTDLRGVAFERGRYVAGGARRRLTGDHVRAQRVISSVWEWVLDPTRCGRLGSAPAFHAQFMAEQFKLPGLACVALDGTTPRRNASEAMDRSSVASSGHLHGRHLQRGPRHPRRRHGPHAAADGERDVFLQQLGRGLRWAPGKSCPDSSRLHRASERQLPIRRQVQGHRRGHPATTRPVGGEQVSRSCRQGVPFASTKSPRKSFSRTSARASGEVVAPSSKTLKVYPRLQRRRLSGIPRGKQFRSPSDVYASPGPDEWDVRLSPSRSWI